MNKTELTIGMIGYRPTMLESMKISFIGEVFGLTNCAVMRELIYGHWTLDELHALARRTCRDHKGLTLPFLKKAFDPKKSVEKILRDANRLYRSEILGFDEHEEPIIWEFIPDNKTNKD
jgi:hypothetical protein